MKVVLPLVKLQPVQELLRIELRFLLLEALLPVHFPFMSRHLMTVRIVLIMMDLMFVMSLRLIRSVRVEM